MKHGRKPTKKQSIFIKKNGLNPENWLIAKDTPEMMLLVHRNFDNRTKTIHKGE